MRHLLVTLFFRPVHALLCGCDYYKRPHGEYWSEWARGEDEAEDGR